MVFSPVSLFLVILPRLPSLVPAVSVPFAVFGVCICLLPLFRVLSSCVDPFPLFCFFRCLSQGACRSFSFSLSSFGSNVSLSDGVARWDESMVLPCISPAFCFKGLVLFLRFRLAWFRSFFCRRLFSIFLRSFRLVRLFFFFLDLFRILYHLISSGSSLGQLCPAIRVLAGVSYFGFSSYVSPCYGPSGCLFGGFPPLPVLISTFSPVARSPSVVRSCFLPRSLSKRSRQSLLLSSLPGSSSSCLASWLGRRPGLALLLLRCVRSWEEFDASLRLISFFVLFVFFLFSYSCCFSSLLYLCSFRFSSYSFSSSFSYCSHLFVQDFFADYSSSSSGSSLSPVSSSSLASSSFRPRSSVRVYGVWGVASSWAFPVALLCLLFWRPLFGLSPMSCLLYVCSLFPSLLLTSFRFGVLCWLRLTGCSLPLFI